MDTLVIEEPLLATVVGAEVKELLFFFQEVPAFINGKSNTKICHVLFIEGIFNLATEITLYALSCHACYNYQVKLT